MLFDDSNSPVTFGLDLVSFWGFPQKKSVTYFSSKINNDNNQEVNLRIKEGQWIVEAPRSSFLKGSNLLLWGAIFLLVGVVIIIIIKKDFVCTPSVYKSIELK
jgi:hypothetical protein